MLQFHLPAVSFSGLRLFARDVRCSKQGWLLLSMRPETPDLVLHLLGPQLLELYAPRRLERISFLLLHSDFSNNVFDAKNSASG